MAGMSFLCWRAAPAWLAALSWSAQAATLTVGPGQSYRTIASAIAAARAGDVLAVSAGTYTNDFAEITVPLSLAASGGRVIMQATSSIPNRKAILITDTDVTITGFDFTGATVSNADGENGAGIRMQGGHLTLNACWFRNNQEGLLASPSPAAVLTINDSEFSNNGDRVGPGAGYTHNLYVNAIASLVVERSYFHNATIGHEIKSRAASTRIDATRIFDGASGTASYSVDLPNGGAAVISNSEIQQGPASQNPIMISFGEEGGLYAGSSLSLRSSILLNTLTRHVPVGVQNDGSAPAALAGDQTYGLTTAQIVAGAASITNLVQLGAKPAMRFSHPWTR